MKALLREAVNTIHYWGLPRWMRQGEIISVRVPVSRSDLMESEICLFCGSRMQIRKITPTFGNSGNEPVIATHILGYRCPQDNIGIMGRQSAIDFYELAKRELTHRGITKRLGELDRLITTVRQ